MLYEHKMNYTSPDIDKNKFRYNEMRKLVQIIQEETKNIVYGKPMPMIIKAKHFENNHKNQYFKNVKMVLDKASNDGI